MRTLTAVTTILLALSVGATVHADEGNKVTICHAAGREGTTHYETLTISENAVFKDQGGHFYENGTPAAGHEQDYLGQCNVPDTTSPTSSVPTSSTEVSTSAPTTTVPEATSTSSTPTNSVDTPTTTESGDSSTSTVAVGTAPVPPNTQSSTRNGESATTTVVAPSTKLPATGSNLNMALIAIGLVALGGGGTLLARRK